MSRHARFVFPVVLATLAGGACAGPEGWTPVLEMTSTSHLETKVERSLEHVSRAREAVRADRDEAERLLGRAEAELRSLSREYLPLFQAKATAFNAYRHYLLGREGSASRELGRVEETFLELSDRVEGTLLQELERLEELVADARVELDADSGEAAEALLHLATELEDLVAKDDLFR